MREVDVVDVDIEAVEVDVVDVRQGDLRTKCWKSLFVVWTTVFLSKI